MLLFCWFAVDNDDGNDNVVDDETASLNVLFSSVPVTVFD